MHPGNPDNAHTITISPKALPAHIAHGDREGSCEDGPDQCSDDPLKQAPGTCGCGIPETDTDNDGTADCVDQCSTDPAKTTPGICDCGIPDTDGDGDGIPDCQDHCPVDPVKTNPGICGCGVPDLDTDADNLADCLDQCPADPAKIEPGICDCGVPETDSDGDGTPDCTDPCPGLPDTLVCSSDTQVVAAGEILVMELDGVRLTIPADTLDTGMLVRLTEVDPSTLPMPPNGNGETRMTPVYSIEFNATRIANGRLTLALDVPESLVTGFYARVKTEGGLGTDGKRDTGWIGTPGKYDAA